ncbi:MAG: hypothetical protein E6J00_14530 [Chloroflexi bacterium]|nr:MAG: hypothetical protein E6J00_14530 [Chloroflexota bacterium]
MASPPDCEKSSVAAIVWRRPLLSAPLNERSLDAADITLFVDQNADIDVAEARQIVGQQIPLTAAELEQQCPARP